MTVLDAEPRDREEYKGPLFGASLDPERAAGAQFLLQVAGGYNPDVEKGSHKWETWCEILLRIEKMGKPGETVLRMMTLTLQQHGAISALQVEGFIDLAPSVANSR